MWGATGLGSGANENCLYSLLLGAILRTIILAICINTDDTQLLYISFKCKEPLSFLTLVCDGWGFIFGLTIF